MAPRRAMTLSSLSTTWRPNGLALMQAVSAQQVETTQSGVVLEVTAVRINVLCEALELGEGGAVKEDLHVKGGVSMSLKHTERSTNEKREKRKMAKHKKKQKQGSLHQSQSFRTGPWRAWPQLSPSV